MMEALAEVANTDRCNGYLELGKDTREINMGKLELTNERLHRIKFSVFLRQGTVLGKDRANI